MIRAAPCRTRTNEKIRLRDCRRYLVRRPVVGRERSADRSEVAELVRENGLRQLGDRVEVGYGRLDRADRHAGHDRVVDRRPFLGVDALRQIGFTAATALKNGRCCFVNFVENVKEDFCRLVTVQN